MKSSVSVLWATGLITLLTITSACETRTIQYAAFKDLAIGSYSVNLYTNGECEVEMGAGYHKGNFTSKSDTIQIVYRENLLKGLPTRLLVTPSFIVTLPTVSYPHSTKIKISRQ